MEHDQTQVSVAQRKKVSRKQHHRYVMEFIFEEQSELFDPTTFATLCYYFGELQLIG